MSGEHRIHPELGAIALRSIAAAAYLAPARSSGRRATGPGQRAHDRVGKAEREEIEIGIGPQHPERQRDERVVSRTGIPARAAVDERDRGPERLRHRVGRGIAIVRALFERAMNHTSTAAVTADPMRAGGWLDMMLW